MRAPQGLPDKAFAVNLDHSWILRSHPCLINSVTNGSLLEYLRPSGSKGRFSQPILRCHEKDLSYVGDRTNISLSTVVMNFTYYAYTSLLPPGSPPETTTASIGVPATSKRGMT